MFNFIYWPPIHRSCGYGINLQQNLLNKSRLHYLVVYMLSYKCTSLDKYLPCKFQGDNIKVRISMKVQMWKNQVWSGKQGADRNLASESNEVIPEAPLSPHPVLSPRPVPGWGVKTRWGKILLFAACVPRKQASLLQDNHVPSKIMVFSNKIIVFQAK